MDIAMPGLNGLEVTRQIVNGQTACARGAADREATRDSQFDRRGKVDEEDGPAIEHQRQDCRVAPNADHGAP